MDRFFEEPANFFTYKHLIYLCDVQSSPVPRPPPLEADPRGTLLVLTGRALTVRNRGRARAGRGGSVGTPPPPAPELCTPEEGRQIK
jgi:hypothetical protein